MKHSNMISFIQDFGDAIGGIFIGNAIATKDLFLGTLGTIFILTSIYLRFYHKKKIQ